jgi:hypothetical protein
MVGRAVALWLDGGSQLGCKSLQCGVHGTPSMSYGGLLIEVLSYIEVTLQIKIVLLYVVCTVISYETLARVLGLVTCFAAAVAADLFACPASRAAGAFIFAYFKFTMISVELRPMSKGK